MKIDKTGETQSEPGRGMTLEQVRSLPVTINVVTAARALGVGPNTAYAAIRDGVFPLDMISVGGSKRVLTASLWRHLQIEGLVAA
ncbi:DNA-binding protein [Kitasatospora sp. NPDC054768]